MQVLGFFLFFTDFLLNLHGNNENRATEDISALPINLQASGSKCMRVIRLDILFFK